MDFVTDFFGVHFYRNMICLSFGLGIIAILAIIRHEKQRASRRREFSVAVRERHERFCQSVRERKEEEKRKNKLAKKAERFQKKAEKKKREK